MKVEQHSNCEKFTSSLTVAKNNFVKGEGVLFQESPEIKSPTLFSCQFFLGKSTNYSGGHNSGDPDVSERVHIQSL